MMNFNKIKNRKYLNRFIFCFFIILFWGNIQSYAQKYPAGTHDPKIPKAKSLIGSLDFFYKHSQCGLEYITKTQVLKQRYPDYIGVTQPANYKITGLPNNAKIIKAFMWASASATDLGKVNNFNITLEDPQNQKSTYQAQLIGSGPDKCWGKYGFGYSGSYTYRADVTSAITGNGTYKISGFPVDPDPSKDASFDTDGATLLIIYSNPSNKNTGTIYIDDGAAVAIGESTSLVLKGFNMKSTATNISAFAMIGDVQLLSTFYIGNASSIPFYGSYWDFFKRDPNLNFGQDSINFYIESDPLDCYVWTAMGVYWQEAGSQYKPTISLAPDTPICQGDSVALTADSAPSIGSFLWTPSNKSDTSIIESPDSTTEYTVTYSDTLGCQDSAKATVIVNPIPTIVASSGAVCRGDSITISATADPAGGSYKWSYKNKTDSIIKISPTSTLIDTVTYTSLNGCINSDTALITVNPIPTVQIDNDTICFGDTATLSAIASPGGGSFAWSPIHETDSIIKVNPTSTTTYTLTYTSLAGCVFQDSAVVIVNPLPQVSAKGTEICDGDSTTIISNVDNVGGKYNWSPTNETDSSINVSPNSTTTYTLTYTDLNGCTNSDTAIVEVNITPILSVTNDTICPADSGTLYSTVNRSGGKYNWSPGNFTDSILTVAPNQTTTYTLSYSLGGCTAVDTGTIIVGGVVITSGNQICEGDSITLSARGTPAGGNYSWSPGNENDSVITVHPTNNTTYTVHYTTKSGCDAKDTAIITVHPSPKVNVHGGEICKGDSITLTAHVNHSVGSYIWTPTNKTDSSIRVHPNTNTTYTVTYTDSLGCKNTDTATVIVNPIPTVSAIGGKICKGDSIIVKANVSPSGGSFSWSYKNQTDSIIKISPSKTIIDTITYTSLAGCINSDTARIKVNPIPTVQVDNDTICFGDTVILSAIVSPGGGSFIWSPTNKTNSIIKVNPTSTTTYTVTYTSLEGCVFQDSAVVIVNPLPIANFGLTNVCPDTATDFTDSSIAPNSGSIISWHWDFDDGDTSSVQNPNHPYPHDGTYNVILTVTNNNGCVDTASKTAIVFPNPKPKFDIKNACLGEPVILTDKSTGTITQWEWDIDNDGITDYTSDSVSHTYPALGSYLVHLKVTTNHGCVADTTETAIVSDPKAAFSASTACAGDTTLFTNQSSSNATSWKWDFGDSTTSSKQNPNHTYPSTGTYNATLIIEGSGCKDTIQHTVTVKQNPSADFTWDIACPENSTSFTNATGGTTNNSYDWGFGDKSGTSTNENPGYSYKSGGSYKVILTAISDSGCVDTISQLVNIPYTPVAKFEYDTVCSGNITCFKDISTITKGSITQWLWNWGDNKPNDTTQNPCHKYDSAGTYTVTLVVSSASGCVSDTIQQDIIVVNNSIANFETADVCQDIAAKFNNKSIDNNKNIWDFGDGDSSKSKNPSHQYQRPGTYQVTLITTNKFGCKDTILDSITIFPLPTAIFDLQDICLGDSVYLKDQSKGKISKWEWDIDNDGITDDTTANMSYYYPKVGTYKIKLTITNIYGCTSDTTKSITVSSPTADFSYSQTCEGDTMYFTDKSSPNPSGWNWYFGDSHTSSQQNPSHVFGDTGVYNVKLTITSKGCKDSITKQVVVDPNPVANFNGENLAGCSPWCAKLIDASSISKGSIVNWQWNLGNGSKQNGQQVTACYENKGLGLDQYSIQLKVTSDKGCTDTISKVDFITIYPLPKANFETNPKKGDIYHKKIHFINKSKGANFWRWNFGDGTIASYMKNPIHEYSDTGHYRVYLKVKNQWECVDSIQKIFEIEPIFTLYIPDAFSPSHDNVNDFFFPKGYGIIQQEMYIYDRWGELLYEGHEKDSKWDGTYKGKPVLPEVYVYKIIVKDFKGIFHTYIGHVTVVK